MSVPLFSEGSQASRVARRLMWLGNMAALLILALGEGHVLRRTAAIMGLVCLVGCLLEHWRVHRTSGGEIEPLDLKGRLQ